MNRLVVILAAAAAAVIGVVITASSGAQPSTVVVAGLGAAGIVGFIAPAITRFFLQRTSMNRGDSILDLVGAHGVVVTQIPHDGDGEISLRNGGQLLTLAARAPYPIAIGRLVVVTAVTSASSVMVEATDSPQERLAP